MREGQSKVIYRSDYQPPAFWIDTVELCFDLDPAKTRVLNRMRVRRNPEVAPQPEPPPPREVPRPARPPPREMDPEELAERLVDAVADAEDGLSVDELVEVLGLPDRMLGRELLELERMGLLTAVDEDGVRRYHLG